MRILFLARSLDVGGAERQLITLAKALEEKGHEISIAVFYSGGLLERELKTSNIQLIDLKKSGRWDVVKFFINFIKAVNAWKPDIIYGFLGVPNIISVLARPFITSRIVWGVRASDMDLSKYDWLARTSYKLECFLSRFSDLIITNSFAGKSYAIKNGFPETKMKVIPNGIDIRKFSRDESQRALVRSELEIQNGTFAIGLVGRIDPMKDLETFLQSIAKLLEDFEGFKVIIVGDGPIAYKEKMISLSQSLNLSDHIIWLGSRLDVNRVYNAFDVLVLSSITEGFPNVIAEAMLTGVPCVVTDVGDSKQIVQQYGSVVPSRDPDQLAMAIKKVLASSYEPEVLSSSIRDRFSVETMVNETASALRGVL